MRSSLPFRAALVPAAKPSGSSFSRIVFAETIGGQAHLIPDEDRDGWREALSRVIEDDDWHQFLCQGAVQLALNYLWQKCAAETMQVYRLVAADAGTTRSLAA